MAWWIGYAKAGQEFAVRDDAQALGLDVRVGRVLESRRVGNARRETAYDRPHAPNYFFALVTDDQWHQLHRLKHVGTLRLIPKGEERSVLAYLDALEADYAERSARVAMGERLSSYQDGDLVRITHGALAGSLAKFRALVDAARDIDVRVAVEVGNIAGVPITMKMDPHHISREAAE